MKKPIFAVTALLLCLSVHAHAEPQQGGGGAAIVRDGKIEIIDVSGGNTIEGRDIEQYRLQQLPRPMLEALDSLTIRATKRNDQQMLLFISEMKKKTPYLIPSNYERTFGPKNLPPEATFIPPCVRISQDSLFIETPVIDLLPQEKIRADLILQGRLDLIPSDRIRLFQSYEQGE